MTLFGLEILIIKGLLGALAGAGIIYVAYLAFAQIKSWFAARASILRQKGKTPVIVNDIQHKIDTGRYSILPGIFDEETKTITEAERFEAEDIEEELKEAFKRDGDVLVLKK